MATTLINSLLSLGTKLLPSITASAQAPSSSSSNSNNSERARALAAQDDMESLMVTLKGIKATLLDAEEREIRDHYVKHWLKELKKVASDSEDVLSEYRYEVTRVQVEARKASQQAFGSHKRKQMEYIVSIPDDMVNRLKKIRGRFDEIAKDREALHLRESDGERRPNNKNLRPPTGHMVDEASIFGRDADISKVIDFLLTEKEKPFSVISIVGKGGLGKTTIAQLVYKDERVTRCFDLLGWVCVSEEFEVRRLIKETIESVSKINNGVSELSPLQEEIAKIVKDKTILLILDDVWNENRTLWELFQVSFKKAKKVRILVTTRSNKVAKVMQTTMLLRPSNLPQSSCWQLFQHYAFSGTSDTVPKHLIDVGRAIMKKCGGLPLAVKSIASLLRYKTDEEHWTEILESDLWESNASNDIFPALQISYAHLPPRLKPCFLFCSMFPKDYTLEKMNLIELWISHGYIESSGKRRIEEIAGEYYEELQERSFLDEFSYRSKESCKLHDIIHDLARLNSKNEHYSVVINQPLDIQKENVPQEACHLYVGGFVGYVNQTLQKNLKGLRTISTDLRTCSGDLREVHICNLTKFELLRVLELKGDVLIGIPDSISELKHLTYLRLTSSRLKMLPLSIGLLYNLQTLILDCNHLKYLPESIGNLLNLQFLNIKSRNLRNLPKSLGELSNLLRLFIGGYIFLDYVPHGLVNFPAIKTMRAWLIVKTIAWLKDMTDLEGNLSIYGMSNLKDAQRANMRNKCKLETLHLSNYLDDSDYPQESELKLILKPEACEDKWVGVHDAAFSWLESLQPHPNLKKLQLRYYSSATVPGWMSDPSSLQSILKIQLISCTNIESLPFRNLHTLKHLCIVQCHSIRVLQLEQLPSQLEELHILWCRNLELITGLGKLDMLATLEISSCEVLKSITMDGLQLVKTTEPIGDSSHGKPHIDRQSISSLTRLQILDCGLLHILPDGLIPSGPCYVHVGRCGCPDIKIRFLQIEACDVRANAPQSPPRPMVTEEEYIRLPNDLRVLHDHLMTAPEGMEDIIIPVPPGMFLHEGRDLLLLFKDFKDLFHHSSSDKWLDVSFITIFLMKLIRNCDEMVEKKNLCIFLDPEKVSSTAVTYYSDMAIEYMCSAMHCAKAEEKKFILVPYHQSKHWCSIIIVPYLNVGIIVDSCKPKRRIAPDKYKVIFPFVNKAFTKYIKEGGLHSTGTRKKNKLNWKWMLSPQQLESWECAYYTMIFMFDFVERIQFQFPKVNVTKQPHYTKDQIDDVRCMWARWFTMEFCNPRYGFA